MQKQFSLQFLQNEPRAPEGTPFEAPKLSSDPILVASNESSRVDDTLVEARQEEVVRAGARTKTHSGGGVDPDLLALLEQMHIECKTDSINVPHSVSIELASQEPPSMMESASIDLVVEKPLPMTEIARINPVVKKPSPLKENTSINPVVKKTFPMKARASINLVKKPPPIKERASINLAVKKTSPMKEVATPFRPHESAEASKKNVFLDFAVKLTRFFSNCLDG